MSPVSQSELLAALGYEVFEAGDDCLIERFPFLEVFLPEAEQFWTAPGTRRTLRSDYWTQASADGHERHYSATAILLGARRLLLVESAGERFAEAQRRVHYAHEISLAKERVEKLSRELEKATQAKSEFLARMSHEIRTPMNALLGTVELLLETQLNVEQREYLRVFQRAGDQLFNVVNEILDFSKMEAGQIELENVEFDLRDVVEGALEVVAVRAHAKGLEVCGRVMPGTPQRVVGDAGRLRQVLLNLLGNAVKFTERGELNVLVSGDAAGQLHCAVSDTGIGIPEEHLSTIFESFSQADVSTTRRYGGTGLGLAISKRFVELMGGRIWAVSKPGEGTTMQFTARLGIAPASAAVSEGIGVRCVVVDSHAASRAAVVEMLKECGAEVCEEGADFAFIDARFGMPDRSIAKRLVMMLTADRIADAARIRADGLEYVMKPVRRAALLRILRGEDAAEHEATAECVTSGRPLRILLADDSDDNRFLIRNYLKDTNWVIDEAEDGAAAVEKFKLHPYDLVLTDVEMPVMDGLAATREMRRFERERGSAPATILALTAHALNEARQSSLEAGCTGHLTKPIRKRALLKAIGQYVPEQPDGENDSVEPWLKPLISGYLEKRRNDVAVLRAAAAREDYACVRKLGHQMAGTGCSYGFEQITDIGLALEQAALKRDPGRVANGIQELDAFLSRC